MIGEPPESCMTTDSRSLSRPIRVLSLSCSRCSHRTFGIESPFPSTGGVPSARSGSGHSTESTSGVWMEDCGFSHRKIMVVRRGCVQQRSPGSECALHIIYMMGKKPITARPSLVLLSRLIPCRDPVDFRAMPVQIMRLGGQNSRVARWYWQALWKEINSALDRFPHNFISMERVFETRNRSRRASYV
jgi:hypothetical protein